MLQFLESPVIMTLIIMFFFLFFLISFLTMLPKTNGKTRGAATSMKVARKNRSECTMLGYLKKLPKGDPIPKECLDCQKLVECAIAKRAFDWYLGRNSTQNSKIARTNRTETLKHI